MVCLIHCCGHGSVHIDIFLAPYLWQPVLVWYIGECMVSMMKFNMLHHNYGNTNQILIFHRYV